MKYVVIDLEMCKVPKSLRTPEFPWCQETIQIGAVLLDEDFVEVYQQAENEEELNEQTYIVTRENLEEIQQAFQPEEREGHGLSDEEVLALRRQRWTK